MLLLHKTTGHDETNESDYKNQNINDDAQLDAKKKIPAFVQPLMCYFVEDNVYISNIEILNRINQINENYYKSFYPHKYKAMQKFSWEDISDLLIPCTLQDIKPTEKQRICSLKEKRIPLPVVMKIFNFHNYVKVLAAHGACKLTDVVKHHICELKRKRNLKLVDIKRGGLKFIKSLGKSSRLVYLEETRGLGVAGGWEKGCCSPYRILPLPINCIYLSLYKPICNHVYSLYFSYQYIKATNY